jgi:hypothetical protein
MHALIGRSKAGPEPDGDQTKARQAHWHSDGTGMSWAEPHTMSRPGVAVPMARELSGGTTGAGHLRAGRPRPDQPRTRRSSHPHCLPAKQKKIPLLYFTSCASPRRVPSHGSPAAREEDVPVVAGAPRRPRIGLAPVIPCLSLCDVDGLLLSFESSLRECSYLAWLVSVNFRCVRGTDVPAKVFSF